MDFGNTRTFVRRGKTYGESLKSGASGEPVFGRPSKPRDEEPSLGQLMTWQTPVVEKADFKKVKKDILPFEDPQFEFYRSKIQKAEDPWVSEARDNYRNFKNPERDAKTIHWNPLSGEYSAPIPPKGGNGGVDMQHHAMKARRIEYPTAAGNEFAASPMRSQPQLGQAQQNAQYMQQHPGQLLQVQQVPAHMNTTHSMLSPSQVQYPPGMEMANTQQSQPAGGRAQHFEFPEVDQEEYPDYYGEEEVDPKEAEQAALDHQHMKEFIRTARWKPDTYTQKVLARPAFMNYGYKNVKPSVGGFLYGQYLHSHNVNPQRGMQPEYRQVYKNAQRFGDRVPPHVAAQIPRPKPVTKNDEKATEEALKRNPLTAGKLGEEEEDEKEKKGTKKKTTGMMRPQSAGPRQSGAGASMQGSVGKASPMQSQMQSPNQKPQQPQQSQPRLAIQLQSAQGGQSPQITVTPADLDKQRAQMTAAEKERLMAKVGKDGGYGNNNNHLSPKDMNKTVKFANNGGQQPHVGFVDQLSETKKVPRRDSGHESNYGGPSSIGKYPGGYDDFLEAGSGF